MEETTNGSNQQAEIDRLDAEVDALARQLRDAEEVAADRWDELEHERRRAEHYRHHLSAASRTVRNQRDEIRNLQAVLVLERSAKRSLAFELEGLRARFVPGRRQRPRVSERIRESIAPGLQTALVMLARSVLPQRGGA